MFLKLSCVHVIIMVQFVDAPVSGGINAASAGTLTFMVNFSCPWIIPSFSAHQVGADSDDTFAAAEILLKDMGAKVEKTSLIQDTMSNCAYFRSPTVGVWVPGER